MRMNRIFGAGLVLLTAALAVPAAIAAPSGIGGVLDPVPPLIEATRDGDLDRIRDLVRSGADVNAAEGDGMTALHWAAHLNHVETAEILIFAGARLEPRTRIGGYTPLLVAARIGSAEVIEVLLAAGADPAVRTTTGGTSALHFAADAGNPRAVELLVRAGVEIDAPEDHWGHTPLMMAAAQGRLEAVRALLSAGAEVSLVNRAVDMATRQREDQQLRQLRNRQVTFQEELERDTRAATAPLVEETEEEVPPGEEGAEEPAAEEPVEEEPAEEEPVEEEPVEEEPAPVEEEVEEEAPPAHTPDVDPELAAVPEPLEPLEEATSEEGEGAPPRAEFVPLSYADLVGGYGGFTALHLAARHGHRDIVMELLDAGAELNHPSEGDHTTPLLIATLNGHWDLALELLERGADPNVTSDAGVGPLYAVLNLQWAPKALHPQPRAHLVQQVTYLEAMERFLEAGADPNARLTRHLWYKSYNFDLLGVDSWGASPFWRAAYGTDVRAMRLLLDHGADPTVATRKPASGRGRGGDDGGDDAEPELDPSGLLPVEAGDPSVTALHAASGVGYGEGFAANAHQHVPGGWLPAVRFLIEEVGLEVDARDHNGFTPLHHAAARGDLELIQYLVDQGADVKAVSRSGLTTADMANGPAQRVPPYPAAIALLRELGSDFNNRCLSC